MFIATPGFPRRKLRRSGMDSPTLCHAAPTELTNCGIPDPGGADASGYKHDAPPGHKICGKTFNRELARINAKGIPWQHILSLTPAPVAP